jgi:hypothetical protein
MAAPRLGSAALLLILADSTVTLATPVAIIPSIPELGAPLFSFPTSGNTTGANGATGSGSASTDVSAGSTDALAQLLSTSYGSSAVSAATTAGISPAALAAFGEVESNFRNVDAANGSSSATGVWQITDGTWNDTVAKYGLNYTSADRNDPTAQAAVASYIISDYADSVSTKTGTPATVVQTYGAYVFGTTAGGNMAQATTDAPLSQYVSATALSNNNMTGWTVGQFYSAMATKLGTAATDTVGTG